MITASTSSLSYSSQPSSRFFLVVLFAERFLAALFFFFLATAFVISRLVIGTLESLRVDFRTTDFFAMISHS
jgi:hypothetical protein